MIVLVMGGTRSGKSYLVINIFKDKNEVIYIVTGIVFDKEYKQRKIT